MAAELETARADQPIISIKPADFPPVMAANSPLTPYSAVAPPQFLEVYKLHVHLSLETIYEEDSTEDDNFMGMFQASSTSPPSFMSSMCFLEVHKPISSSYTHHNCQCA
ncbi:hypothetical protein FNV43_RR06637 [Rhamnella rubrinervis]|uniref:Uncharacterized protein n=1 Tax=Rhamnella rubrinervis TaxID=2594499 RepID=A0A8K0HDX3_9ROSA|nr:hypothetical protein FNV43_RR06637 [Rhamnella rubrinervis]